MWAGTRVWVRGEGSAHFCLYCGEIRANSGGSLSMVCSSARRPTSSQRRVNKPQRPELRRVLSDKGVTGGSLEDSVRDTSSTMLLRHRRSDPLTLTLTSQTRCHHLPAHWVLLAMGLLPPPPAYKLWNHARATLPSTMAVHHPPRADPTSIYTSNTVE